MINRLFRNFSLTGTADALDSERQRIVLVNVSAMSFGCTALLWTIVQGLSGYLDMVLTTFVSGILVSFTLLFNARRKHAAARVYLQLLTTAIVLMFTVFLGEQSNAAMLFIPVAVLPFAMFPGSERLKPFSFSLIAIVLLAVCENLDLAPLIAANAFVDSLFLRSMTAVTAAAITLLLLALMFRFNHLSERRAEESTASLRQILDAVPDLVFLKDEKFRLRWVNRAFAEFYGLSPEALRDTVDSERNDPSFTARYLVDDAWVFEHGKVREVKAEPVVRHDGTVALFNTIKAPIFDAEGKVVQLVGVARDVTDAIQHQEAEDRHQQELMQNFKLASLGEMASAIAHEINNPLAIILGKSSRLTGQLQGGVDGPDKLLKHATDIQATALRISKIIGALSCYSRDHASLALSEIDAVSLVEDLLNLSQSRVTTQGIHLHKPTAQPGIAVWCRPDQVSQILLNLLNNAVDAVEELEIKWIAIDITEKADIIEIGVSDSGGGIPEETLKKIARPFFTTKPVGKGTGLGLSISRRMAEDQGGALVYDKDCPNTRFALQLRKVIAIPAKGAA